MFWCNLASNGQSCWFLLSGSPSYILKFYIIADQLVCCGVISVENLSLEDLVGSHFPLWIGMLGGGGWIVYEFELEETLKYYHLCPILTGGGRGRDRHAVYLHVGQPVSLQGERVWSRIRWRPYKWQFCCINENFGHVSWPYSGLCEIT